MLLHIFNLVIIVLSNLFVSLNLTSNTILYINFYDMSHTTMLYKKIVEVVEVNGARPAGNRK